MSSALKEWQEKEFNHFLKDKSTGIVEFGAAWCSACKIVEPIVADVSSKFPKMSFARVDVAKNPGLASRMGVMSLPNILIIKHGKVIDQIIGACNAKTLETKIKKQSPADEIGKEGKT
jgi:thioredoxin 1